MKALALKHSIGISLYSQQCGLIIPVTDVACTNASGVLIVA